MLNCVPNRQSIGLVSSIECRHYLKSQVRVIEALPLRSIDCRVGLLAYTAPSIGGISRNRQVTYSEVKEMWKTFFVCKPVGVYVSGWTSESVSMTACSNQGKAATNQNRYYSILQLPAARYIFSKFFVRVWWTYNDRFH